MNDRDEQGTHYWHMTIQTDRISSPGSGFIIGSYQGTWTPEPGQTRLDMHNSVRDLINERYPEMRGGIVLTFDFQSNAL